MANELGEWVGDAWARATEMHVCFHEGWCAREDVEASIKHIEKLVEEIASRIKRRR